MILDTMLEKVERRLRARARTEIEKEIKKTKPPNGTKRSKLKGSDKFAAYVDRVLKEAEEEHGSL